MLNSSIIPDTGSLLLIALIVVIAFLIKATTGFGENLVMIPSLLMMLDLKVVLPLTLIIVLVADAYLLYNFHGDIRWSIFWRFLPPAVIGIVLGTMGLQYIEEGFLETVLGIIVVSYASYTLVRRTPRGNAIYPKIWSYVAGFFGGGFSGLLGIGGPPVIAYLNYYGVAKHVFRATCIITLPKS